MPWLILFFLALLPFLTHYITYNLFYRSQRSKSSDKTPPTIPYWIPGVFHALGLLSSPSAYFALLIRKYGNYAPFVVRLGRSSYIVIRDPDHVQKAFQSSDSLAATSAISEHYSKILGAPKEAIDYYRIFNTDLKDNDRIHLAHVALPHKYFTGVALNALTEIYVSILRRNMSNKMFQIGSWTQIEDLWSFFEIDITRATTETLFGSALLKQYPKIGRDLWDFNSKVDEFLPGLPHFTVSSSIAPRDRLLEGLKKWLQATHGGRDFAKISDNDPVWDESKGSKFIQERDNVFANMPSFNYEARAAENLSILQSLNAITMPSAFWSIVETLRNPALISFLAAIIERNHISKEGTYNITAIAELPNMQSFHNEIRRLRTATRRFRTNKGDYIQLDGSWLVPKGMSVITFSQDISLNTALWAKANPRTIARPLEEFWPERFLIPDKSTSTKRYRKDRDSVTTGTFSLEGLESLHAALGGANFSEPERTFAKAIQTATLAVMLTDFEIELCDIEATEEALPPLRETAYGTVKPTDKIAIRIRKRAVGENAI